MILRKSFKLLYILPVRFNFLSSDTLYSAMQTVNRDQTIEWMESDHGIHQPFPPASDADHDDVEPSSIMEFNVSRDWLRCERLLERWRRLWPLFNLETQG